MHTREMETDFWFHTYYTALHALQYITFNCTTLHCTTLHYTTPHPIAALHFMTIQGVSHIQSFRAPELLLQPGKTSSLLNSLGSLKIMLSFYRPSTQFPESCRWNNKTIKQQNRRKKKKKKHLTHVLSFSMCLPEICRTFSSSSESWKELGPAAAQNGTPQMGQNLPNR